MPYYPRANDRTYFCPNCRGWFWRASGNIQVLCTVYHAPGACCHYGETPVDDQDRPVPTAPDGANKKGE